MRYHTFRNSYSEAREAFLQASEGAGGTVFSHAYPHTSGPFGEPLFTDATRFGPEEARNILLCVSGTHGAEGFPGSAVQIDWVLREGKTWAEAQGDTAVWVVHAVNPFGFAWQMRNNEDHIDLNRNWIDFTSQRPENIEFDELAPLLSAYNLTEAKHSEVVNELNKLTDEKSADWVENILTRGQFDHPDLMFYGGAGEAHSRKVVSTIVRENLTCAERVAYVDLHSGTVGIGELIFLCFSPPRSDEFSRAASWWGSENLDPVEVEKRWGGARPERHGLTYWGLDELFGPDVSFAGAVVEFGTLAPQDKDLPNFAALSEAWLRQRNNFHDPKQAEHVELMRKCFDRPGDLEWERKVIEKGSWVLERALNGLVDWANECKLASVAESSRFFGD